MKLAPAFLLSSGLLALGSSAQTADLIVVNGKVVTMNPAQPRAEAVAVRGGVIAAVGSNADIRQLAGPRTRTIDAVGRSVIPGLVEGHVHATGAARGDAQVPYRQLYSIGEIQDWLRRRIREVGPGVWIELPRVDVTRIKERRLPAKADLDAAAPNHPVVFTWRYANRVIQILNSAAVKAAGLTHATKAPEGGKIHLDARGEPTGTIDDSSGLVQKFLATPAPSDEKYHDTLVRLLGNYNAIGITSIGDRHVSIEGVRAYQLLRQQNRLTVRVTATIGLRSDGTVAGTERAIGTLGIKPGEGDDWVKAGPLKIIVDGGILYGTAHMREPYGPKAFSLYNISDPAYKGSQRIGPEQLKNIIRTGHRMGWQMSSHVTGDLAVDTVLDAVEAADADRPIAPRRYNIIHGYFPNPATAQRAARLGVCVDTQPMWYYKDGDALAEALGAGRLEHFIGLQTWQRGGVKVAINADHMQGLDPDTSLNPYNPFLAMQAAITRRTEGGRLFGPGERVSREEALRMMTLDAAWFSFDEKKKGSLEVGKFADLAILTADYLTVPEDKLKDIRAQTTIVDGKVVYERTDGATAR